MRTAKQLLLIILCMIIVFSCNRYTEPESQVLNEQDSGTEIVDNGVNKGGNEIVADTGPFSGSGGGTKVGNWTLPRNSLSQAEQKEDYDPEFNSMVLFDKGGVPALTTTSKGVLIAAVGGYDGNILVKRSLDSGYSWFTSSIGAVGNYSHSPFFINCHNGDVLLGITTVSDGETNTIFYRTVNDGGSWTKDVNVIKVGDVVTSVAGQTITNFVTYGQGLTLRYGVNKGQNKLMFPYYYLTNSSDNNNTGVYTVPMLSQDDGRSWNKGGNPYGSFTSYESKLYELSDGSILLNMRTAKFNGRMGNNYMYWFKSTDYGQKWSIETGGTAELANAKHADLVRYEFNGKPIKAEGSKYGLMRSLTICKIVIALDLL